MLKGNVLSSLDLFINLYQTYILHILQYNTILYFTTQTGSSERTPAYTYTFEISTEWTVRDYEVITHISAYMSLYLH